MIRGIVSCVRRLGAPALARRRSPFAVWPRGAARMRSGHLAQGRGGDQGARVALTTQKPDRYRRGFVFPGDLARWTTSVTPSSS